MKSLSRQEEQILLSIYHLQEDAYLVNIREKLKEMTGKYLDVSTINKSLKRLERDAYLDSYSGDPTPVRGGRAIKYYRLTGRASEELKEIKSVYEKMWENVIFPLKNS